jgi:uncharacterized protein YydD (DUF2326 family)
MQLSRIYSNKPSIFTQIILNCGDEPGPLNVIYGQVRKPDDKTRDSHNLGKTTLLHLIDFLMLRGVTPDFFLRRHKERFKGFVFYLEVKLNAGDFTTIRRGVDDPNSVAMKRHAESGVQFVDAPDEAWNHVSLNRDNAVKLLDAWLGLAVISPYNYRVAITYFLRAQGDWGDELALQKFRVGRDQYWKPFIAKLFGFNEAPVSRKYELDESIDKLRTQLAERQAEVQFTEDELPALTSRLTVLQKQAEETEEELDAFNFGESERAMMEELVGEIEHRIADINERIYNLRYDLTQITSALSHRDKFDLREVAQIFDEVKLHFPDGLKRKYEELVAFNRKVTNERNTELRKRQAQLAAEEADLVTEKKALEMRRVQSLRVLRGTDTFEKFKSLQNSLTKERAQIVYLEQQREKLQIVADLARKLREEVRECERVVDETKAMVERGTALYSRFTTTFSSYCMRVLQHDGVFNLRVNNSGNLDHNIALSLQGDIGSISSQSEGTSYKKMLCALFDLALLKVYEDAPFFHFVYHDGILEGLDDRKKLAFLALVREQIASGKTQYIMTMIDSDIPRDAKDERVAFGTNEIVLQLHDDGMEGRLFKMAEF